MKEALEMEASKRSGIQLQQRYSRSFSSRKGGMHGEIVGCRSDLLIFYGSIFKLGRKHEQSFFKRKRRRAKRIMGATAEVIFFLFGSGSASEEQ